MSKFQIAVLSLLGLIACVLFGGIGFIYFTFMSSTAKSEQVSISTTAVQITNTATPQPVPTSDRRFTITQSSLGSRSALAKEITSKGWKFTHDETATDGTNCSIYIGGSVTFGLCSVGVNLKAIVIKGDASADFNPVFAVASMYQLNYPGGLEDKVTDTWFALAPGESTTLDVDNGVFMTIQRTYDDGYGITYILGSHLP